MENSTDTKSNAPTTLERISSSIQQFIPRFSDVSATSAPAVTSLTPRDDSLLSYIEEDDSTPIIFSWGRSDTSTLLESKDTSIIDGIATYKSNRKVFVQIGSNEYHTVLLTTTGDVFTCGSNEEWQACEDKYEKIVTKPRLFDLGSHRVTAIAAGLYHSVCVTASGVVLSFGGNEVGQLGHSKSSAKASPAKVNFNIKGNYVLVVKRVCCGDFFTLFLTTTGEVYGCGLGLNLGNPNPPDSCFVAERIEALVGSNVVAISAGSSHAFALTSNGELFAWGDNRHGQLGIGIEESHIQIPVMVPFSSIDGRIVGISCGSSHSLIWTDQGVLYGAGLNKYGQLGGSLPRHSSFQRIDGVGFCVQAACGKNHSLILSCDPVSNEQKIWGCGHNIHGQVSAASSSAAPSLFRQPIELVELREKWGVRKILYLAAGGSQSFVIASPLGVMDAGTVLKRLFSSRASTSLGPLSAPELLEIIAVNKPRVGGPISNAPLANAVEIFSSSSLLAASFVPLPGPSATSTSLVSVSSNNLAPVSIVDVDGLEEIYSTLLKLGKEAVDKLNAAFQHVLTDLETSVKANKLVNSIPASLVRVLAIVWLYPINANATMSLDIFPRLVAIIAALPPDLRQKLMNFASSLPPHVFVSRLLRPLQKHLCALVDKIADGTADASLPLYCIMIYWLYDQIRSKGGSDVIPYEEFYNESLSKLPDEILIADFIGYKAHNFQLRAASSGGTPPPPSNQFFISNHPYLLSIDAKRRILLGESRIYQGQAQTAAVHTAVLHAQLAGQSSASVNPFFFITVHRDKLLQTALGQIEAAGDEELRKPLKVEFYQEEGVDAGGVTKEFFQLLTAQLFSPEFGMFSLTEDGRSLWISPSAVWSTQEFHLIGVLLGLAVYNGVLLDVHLPKLFYRKLLHRTMTLNDVGSVDFALCDGLKKLLAYEPAADVEAVFCRTFQVSWDLFGEEQTFDLMPDGASVAVTGDNREAYVKAYVDWYLNQRIKPQFDALFAGFTRVVPATSLLLLNPDELELLMVGKPHFDFVELQKHTEYIGSGGDGALPWTAEHPTVAMFWEVLHAMEFEDKQKFLLFVTGSSKAPVGGLAQLGLKIQRMGPDSESLPTSHTCFNTLLLPEYTSKEKLRNRLYKAIQECEGFGLK